MNILKVAVIGMRQIGNSHAEAYWRMPETELVAVCDLEVSRASVAAAVYGSHSYKNVTEMLDKESLDAVSVCTGGFENGSAHFAPVMACLERGIHVICEKPLSNEIEKTRLLVRTARENDCRLAVNFNHRFVYPVQKTKEWLSEKRLGNLLLMNMIMWTDNANEASEWFHFRALHPHSIDLMRFFCGEVEKVQVFANRSAGRKCWSNFQANIMFENSVVGHLTGSYDGSRRHNLERIELLGTEGRIVLDNCFQELSFYPRLAEEVIRIENDIRRGIGGFKETFEIRLKRWVVQLLNGTPDEQLEGSGMESLAGQTVIEAMISSWQKGGEVISVRDQVDVALSVTT